MRQKRKGAAVVEFAIVAPLFFLLVFGMIEYGRAIMVKQVITNAAREGARYAAVGADDTEVEARVRSYLEDSTIRQFEIEIDRLTGSGGASGDPITVTVNVQFKDVSWLPPFFYHGDLGATATMRKEEA